MTKSSKSLPAKYQIKNNILVACDLELIHKNDQETLVYLGVKESGDTKIPKGTKIFLTPDAFEPAYQAPPEIFERLTIIVKDIETESLSPLHPSQKLPLSQKYILHCSAAQTETHPERRQAVRTPASFKAMADTGNIPFTVFDGSLQGLGLRSKPRRSMLSLSVDHTYPFRIPYKQKEYPINSSIKHITYHWKTLEHEIGIAFSNLTEEVETILKFSLDPSYTVAIPQEETVDTSKGKISKAL